LIKLEATSNIVSRGKLGSKWNGPFKVPEVNIYHFSRYIREESPSRVTLSSFKNIP
jgi:hypothetical protein